jgi:hypothetical protein
MLSVNLLLSKSRKIFLFLVCLAVILIIVEYAVAFQTENVFLVIIDGARYSETIGDETHANIPKMYSLSLNGCVNTSFYNDKKTKTLNGVSAILTGKWTDFTSRGTKLFWPFQKSISFPKVPSIWEYYRKQLNLPQDSSYYSFPGEGGFFQPVSYHKEYGPDYWPMRGHSGSNVESWNELEIIMKSLHPKLVVLYLGETDGAGHSGDWDRYLKTIKTADEIVGALWEKIQLDQHYQNKTTLIVTNDHGRHDDSHSGFKNHGDACDGCQHIMFLAIGPDFKKNYQTNTRRTLIDITPTIGKLLKFNPEYAMGGVMSELFKSP